LRLASASEFEGGRSVEGKVVFIAVVEIRDEPY